MLFTTSILSLHCMWTMKENKLAKLTWIIIAIILYGLRYAKDYKPTLTLHIFLGIAAVNIQSTTVTVYRLFPLFFRSRFFCSVALKRDSCIS